MTMNMADYHPDWRNISRQIREQAGQRCEGTPRYPDCRAENGQRHPETGSRVILTVAHMNFDKSDDGNHGAAARSITVTGGRWVYEPAEEAAQ